MSLRLNSVSMFNPFRRKRQCHRLIKYSSRTIQFDTSIGGGIFELSNFRTEEKVLEQASESAKILDERQFHMCNDYKHLSEDDPRFEEYQKRRDRILDAITSFRLTLTAYQTDPEGQKESLSEAIKDLRKILLAEEVRVSQRVTRQNMRR